MSDKDLTIGKNAELEAGERRVDTWLTPAVDIYENDANLTLVADLPGVPRARLNLGIDKGVLTIEALAPCETEDQGIYREFGTTGYYRRFQLPDSLEFDQVTANMKDGVLRLVLPKAATARPRKIDVKVH